jgi:tRNA A-37 threonylcarbamoyl transferase component Bud32
MEGIGMYKLTSLQSNWKTLTKAGLVFVATTGAFFTLKATGSFSLISSWLKNSLSETDPDESSTLANFNNLSAQIRIAPASEDQPLIAHQYAKRQPSAIIKLGPEFRVNTYTTNSQSDSSVAGLSDGKFVVTWRSDGQDGSGYGVYGQMYNADGSKYSSEFQVNTYTASEQSRPSVAELSDSKFVVAWDSPLNVQGQMFSANGAKFSSEFQVNTIRVPFPGNPSVAGLSDGKFVVTWSKIEDPMNVAGGQMFNANGTKFSSEFLITNLAAPYCKMPNYCNNVEGLNDGKFVMIWTQWPDPLISLSSYEGIYGQIYNANGTKYGSKFYVTTHWTNHSIARLSNNKFVVTWESYGQDGSGYGVYGQMYNADGSKYSSEFQVNTYTASEQSRPSVAELSDSKFVVTWSSDGQDGSYYGIYGQMYNADASKYSSEFRVNTYTTSIQQYPSVAGLSDGKFVVTWMSDGQDGDGYGIYGQMYNVNETSLSSTTSTEEESSSSTLITSEQSQKLSSSETGGISSMVIMLAAIIGGVCVVLCLTGSGVGYWLYRRKRNSETDSETDEEAYQLSELKIANRKSLRSSKRVEKVFGTIDLQKLSGFEEIGRGAMGVVYKAKYRGSDVAVKQVLLNLADSEAMKLLAQEATLMEELRHPNIVQFLGYYQDSTHYSIVMEYVSGGELSKILYDTRKAFPWYPTRWDIAHDIASAVYYLHTNDAIQIIHRDLKSPNVLVYYEGTRMRAKVADVGIAKVISEEDMAMTMTKGMGTPLWMAPEVVKAQGEGQKITYDEKVDVYSYGIILSELINRDAPFSEIENTFKVVPYVLEGGRPEIKETAPVSFIALMKQCWAQRAADRPEMEEVVNALDEMEPEVKSFEC